MATQHFFLQRPDHEEGNIFFCNLVGDPWCPEATAVGGHDWINPKTIAHDLLEHTQYHRKRTYVPWTEELKAFGASVFVREKTIDVQSDFEFAVESMIASVVDAPTVPYTYLNACRDNPLSLVLSSLLDTYDELYHQDIQNVADQINYGYLVRAYSDCMYNLTDFAVVENYFSEWEMPEGATRQYFKYSPECQEVTATKTV